MISRFYHELVFIMLYTSCFSFVLWKFVLVLLSKVLIKGAKELIKFINNKSKVTISLYLLLTLKTDILIVAKSRRCMKLCEYI